MREKHLQWLVVASLCEKIHRESALKTEQLTNQIEVPYFLTANAAQHPRTSYFPLAIATQPRYAA